MLKQFDQLGVWGFFIVVRRIVQIAQFEYLPALGQKEALQVAASLFPYVCLFGQFLQQRLPKGNTGVPDFFKHRFFYNYEKFILALNYFKGRQSSEWLGE